MALETLPADWHAALAPEFSAPYFTTLTEFLREERKTHTVLPPEDTIFNALQTTPLAAVRVVILGQDPYPTPGHAHGLSFSVQPGVTVPASLRNIFKELQSDLDAPKPTSGSLLPWAHQGVLLLNTVLTVRAGEANSHQKKGWEKLTDAIIKTISAKEERVVFLLWGKPAQTKAALIDTTKHTILSAPHPSPLAKGPDGKPAFFGARPFSQANAALREAGLPEIDWKLP